MSTLKNLMDSNMTLVKFSSCTSLCMDLNGLVLYGYDGNILYSHQRCEFPLIMLNFATVWISSWNLFSMTEFFYDRIINILISPDHPIKYNSFAQNNI